MLRVAVFLRFRVELLQKILGHRVLVDTAQSELAEEGLPPLRPRLGGIFQLLKRFAYLFPNSIGRRHGAPSETGIHADCGHNHLT